MTPGASLGAGFGFLAFGPIFENGSAGEPEKVSMVKERIGRYVLLEPVGRGAMGIVYRAEDPNIRRTVAVKVLHTLIGLTPQQAVTARERFSREGQALGSIDHPNIIRVFDVGEDTESGEMYIVMEFVPGPNLEKILEDATLDRTALDLGRSLAIIGQLASGLDAAHARGIIHRDIKPSNILLAEDGTVKIADFGLTLVKTSALTQDSRELGTPAYMSPEQVNGRVLDSKSDLFSLGVLSYEILAGRKPFEGSNAVSIAHAIAHAKPVCISAANPELPQALDRVLERMLSKEPSDRFGSGGAFLEALLPILLEQAADASLSPPTAHRRRPRVVWGIAGIGLLAAAFLLLSWGGRTDPPPNVLPAPANKPQSRPPAKEAPVASSASPKGVEPESRPSSPKVAAIVVPPKTVDVTISFVHHLRRGTLVVLLDGVAIFNEKFSKAKLAVVQTTVWDPLKAPAGGHTLIARVSGEDGKTHVSDSYKFEFPPERGIELRIGLKGDSLTVKQKAD